MRPFLLSCSLLLAACADGEPTDPTDPTGPPTMATPPAPVVVPEDCPRPGRGLIEATVVAADPAITALDEISMVFFPSVGSPPSYSSQSPGADFTSLPAVFLDNNLPPMTWPMVSACMDAGADTFTTCEGPDDVLIVTMDGVPVEANRVTQLEIDFTAGTIASVTVVDPRPDCP